MRIAMIGDYPKERDRIAGGVEAVTRYLLEALEEYDDLEMHMVTLARPGDASRLEKHGKVEVHYVSPSTARGRFSIWSNRRRLAAEVLGIRPDLVHAHIAGYYSDAAMATGLPWALTLHGIRFLEARIRPGFRNRVYRYWLIRREELRAVRRATHVISISPFIEETFAGEIRGKVFDIENPVPEAFFNVPAGAVQPGTILYLGRIIPRKGLHVLLEAFSRVRARHPDLRLRVAGGGVTGVEPTSYAARIGRRVEELELGDAVEFLGELGEERVLEEYARCEVFVLSSGLETAPMVTLQAMAAGKPIVTTDAGGSRYLVEDGTSGFVVPCEDPAALAGALERVFDDDALRGAMAARSREIAEARFRNTVVAERTREVYYDVLGARPPESSVAPFERHDSTTSRA